MAFKRVMISFDDEKVLERLETYCQQTNQAKSKVVSTAVLQYLDAIDSIPLLKTQVAELASAVLELQNKLQ